MSAYTPRVIVPLDFPDMLSAFGLAARLDPRKCAVKVGKELFTAAEAGLVRELVRRGFLVFLDLKFHDIPNTVAQACAAATRMGVWMIDVQTHHVVANLSEAGSGDETDIAGPDHRYLQAGTFVWAPIEALMASSAARGSAAPVIGRPITR